MTTTDEFKKELYATVAQAISEDLGSGDITAELIPDQALAKAKIITRMDAVVCGAPWATEVFRQICPTLRLDWHVKDGEQVTENQCLVEISGHARSILTAERAALNFLQTLSGTATKTSQLQNLVAHTGVQLLDTRKTIPGLRTAQKYAVLAGGGKNHRLGLYDAYLIKENHIYACGNIEAAVSTAKNNHPGKPVEIEVQNMDELAQAIDAEADTIMLDNFSLSLVADAVRFNNGRCKLEASGNIDHTDLLSIAETGVDYISIGALTKHCFAVDLSLLFEHPV
ncbi:MAG: carboxylating nicotinate-nucleotide diphosphorylase [Pseudohongiellaceae bacterium]